jgi:predicted amidohydrolase YtcJ
MDLIITTANIYTGDPARPRARAMAVKDGRIAALGDNDMILAMATAGTQRIDAGGRLVTAGMVDAHLHFVNYGLYLQQVDLRGLKSLAACRESIRQAAVARKPGEWIVGRGWNEHYWEDKRLPHRLDLDDICPDHPVMMVRACGHTQWVNSRALLAAGITRAATDPPGARIEREPSGEPSGLLQEFRKILDRVIPPPTPADLVSAAQKAQDEAFRRGVTGGHSCEWLRHYAALAALEKTGRLKIRIHHLLPPDEIDAALEQGLGPGKGSDRLWFQQVKFLIDGTLGSATALMHEPYEDVPNEYGLACLPPEELQAGIEKAYQAGCGVGVHAIGDHALSVALTAIQAARRRFPGDRKDRIEHVQLFRPQDLALFRSLGITASVQPVHLTTDWPVAQRRWGDLRCRYAYAWKTLLEAGIPLQFGSDAPVEHVDPLPGLYSAVTRRDGRGEPSAGWYPEENLTLAEALSGFTQAAAVVSGRNDRLGTLTPGKYADFTVFGGDLFQEAPEAWISLGVALTAVEGEIVFRDGRV